MGPRGMREVGEYIISITHYAKHMLGAIDGVTTPLTSTPFLELLVSFDGTGLTVEQVNDALLERRILGGHDLSSEYPQFGQSALYCFTDLTTRGDVDTLARALEEVV